MTTRRTAQGMDRFIHGIIRHRKAVVVAFLAAAVVCAAFIPFVKTNYNMVDYLPDEAQSTTAVEIMEQEFSQAVPNANVLVHDVTVPQALAFKDKIAAVDGVEGVMWLDDVMDVAVPLETADQETVETYYRVNDPASSGTGQEAPSATAGAEAAGTALFQVTVAEGEEGTAIPALRGLVDQASADNAAAGGRGLANAVSGEAMDTAQLQANTVQEVLGAVAIIVPAILLLLVLSTLSWIEPVLFIAAIGVSIVLNMGTNIVLGEVSFITYSVSPILQLAVSLDYAIFLLHAFAAERQRDGAERHQEHAQDDHDGYAAHDHVVHRHDVLHVVQVRGLAGRVERPVMACRHVLHGLDGGERLVAFHVGAGVGDDARVVFRVELIGHAGIQKP